MKIISACIPTFKRVGLLKKLLDSLKDQRLPKEYKLEIIVADNDPENSAAQIVKEFSHSFYDIKYFTQPLKNLSITRNLTVKQSLGEILYFIDDDEFAHPDCLGNLIKIMDTTDADVVFGKVIPIYNENAPAWIKKENPYLRKEKGTGNFPKNLKTGNCIIKRSSLEKFTNPFDELFGVTGGEDSHLLRTLLKNNKKFVYTDEAIVYEYYPPKRTNLLWIIKRSFRTGNTFTKSHLDLSGNKFHLKIFHLIKAMFYFIFSTIMVLLLAPFRTLFINWIIRASSNAGHAFAILGIHYKEYK